MPSNTSFTVTYCPFCASIVIDHGRYWHFRVSAGNGGFVADSCGVKTENDFGTVGWALAPGYLRSYASAGSLLDDAKTGCITVGMFGKLLGKPKPLHAGGVAGAPDEGRLVTENEGDGVGGTSKRTCL
jgi:hypothetical protein